MIFPVDEKYRIRGETRQWVIDRCRPKKGKPVWEPQHYFTRFDTCVQYLGDILCRELDTDGVAEALCGIEAVGAKLARALSPQFDVVTRPGDAPADSLRLSKTPPPASTGQVRANSAASGRAS